MTQITLPKLNQTGANEWADVEDNDKAIRDVVNGQLDNENLKEGAGITDGKLASPNNSAYRILLSAASFLGADAAASTYLLGSSSATTYAVGPGVNSAGSTSANAAPFFYFDNDDYTVSGKTQKLRIRANVMTNATKPIMKFTVGLYPVLEIGGVADQLTLNLGSVVGSSSVQINEPAASSVTQAASSEFAVPADGVYCLGCLTSATLTNNALVLINAQLQTRNI